MSLYYNKTNTIIIVSRNGQIVRKYLVRFVGLRRL